MKWFLLLAIAALPAAGSIAQSGWPIRCPDGSERNCLADIGYPDIDGDGLDSTCQQVRRRGHTGTDLVPTSSAMQVGVAVVAVAPGTVIFVEDKLFDECPADHPECRPASRRKIRPYFSGGYTTCTGQGQYCSGGASSCFWCFSGNYVVLEHDDSFTAYLHLSTDSVPVAPGDIVAAGDVIGYVGSSGNSNGPHLHFEVWRGGLFQPEDPWQGDCGRLEAWWYR